MFQPWQSRNPWDKSGELEPFRDPEAQQQEQDSNLLVYSKKRHRDSTSTLDEPKDKRLRNLGSWSPDKGSQGWYWILIGECYVHGMMDGQARRVRRAERPHCLGDVIFELR